MISQPSLPLPTQVPKSTQAAHSLKAAIEQGLWKGVLPSERRLSEILFVSRPTIRTALQILAKEGLIEIHQGRSNRILKPAPPRTFRPNSHLIGVITSVPASSVAMNATQGLSEMREHLALNGFQTEGLVCNEQTAEAQQRKVEAFVRKNNAFCYLLASVSKELQLWFVKKKIRCLVLGSCHDEVVLPALSVDYKAVCRHAVGVFASHGHPRIALLTRESRLAGDLEGEQGFLDGLKQNADGYELRGVIVRHNGTSSQINSALKRLMFSAEPPTGLLVAYPYDAVIANYCLARNRIDVPGTVSLIARDEDHLFTLFDPQIAHYRCLEHGLFHRLTRLMLKLVRHDHLAFKQSLMFPTFVPGGSLRRISTSALSA